MPTFSDRSTLLERLLETRQSSDGGWPQKLEVDDAPTTIVGSAQALEILRMRGLEYRDAQVQRGLRYLATQVRTQTSNSRADGRGEWSRFPAYALWGLMRYPAARHDKQLGQGVVFSYEWLSKHQLPSGGWSQSREEEPLWLPATMVAVHALDRLAIYSGATKAQEISGIADRARDHILAQAQVKNGDRQSFWTQAVGGQSCPGATSLAVLTLAGGAEIHRQAARAGINWLGANRGEWTQRAHFDEQMESRRWRILTFSLGLRALMHPCGMRDLKDPAVAEVVQHIDTLWSTEHHAWADGPGLKASTSGSYAVMAAVHALKRAYPFDPFEHLGIRPQHSPNSSNKSPRAHRKLYISIPQQSIRLEDDSGDLIVQTPVPGRSQWSILLALARRHHEAISKGSNSQTDMTISLEDCARLGANDKGTTTEAVERTIRRLHEMLAREAMKYSHRGFVDLIEDHVPGGSTERRLALEEIDVYFTDGLPALTAA